MPAEAQTVFLGLHPVIAQILYNRGLRRSEELESFLAEKPPVTAHPSLMKGVAEAVQRLREAAEAGETVAVYGDYDVDGITAAALLTEALTAVGIKVVPHIPTRAEGYGVHVAALRALAERGIRLAVTVDCGINSAAEVAEGKRAGMEVIVTDHHRIEGTLPSAVSAINPRQPGCDYPFKELAAVGVALKLAQALVSRLPLTPGADKVALYDRFLELVALGTVADVAPLVGENRALVRRGLEALNTTKRPGLRALMDSARLRNGAVDTNAISYGLAPRLNASGRLQDAFAAYRLLLCESEAEALELSRGLEAANQQRQRLTSDVVGRAMEQVTAGPMAKLLFAAAPDFPSGIVGLAAGKLCEELGRPAFVVQAGEVESRGSARGIDGFNVTEALASCADLLTRYGGHAQAAGFSFPTANLGALRDSLQRFGNERLEESDLCRRLEIDAETRLSAIDPAFYARLCALAPFGHGNPAPVFVTRRVKVAASRVVGKEAPGHLRLDVHDGERFPQERTSRWQAIGFGMGAAASRLATQIDIVYTVELNEWEGRQSIELRLRDWRPS